MRDELEDDATLEALAMERRATSAEGVRPMGEGGEEIEHGERE